MKPTNFGSYQNRDLFAINDLPIEFYNQLSMAEETANCFFTMTHPPTFGPFNLIHFVRLWSPVCYFLERAKPFQEVCAIGWRISCRCSFSTLGRVLVLSPFGNDGGESCRQVCSLP